MAGWKGNVIPGEGFQIVDIYRPKQQKIVYTAPKAPVSTSAKKKKKTSTVPKKSSGSGSGGSSGGGGGGGGGGIQKASDKPQLAALKSLLDSGFKKALDQKLANTQLLYEQQDADLLKGYRARAGGLAGSRADNDKSEVDASFGNLSNRAREAKDTLAQAAMQGAGETDTLKTQLMAIRNWDANQADINRSFFDTQRSINSSVADLNADTRTARINLATGALGDYDQAWTNYYNQRADAYTQMGNIHANPYSDSHNTKSTAFKDMAKEASSSWKNPGVQANIRNWEGTLKEQEQKLNNSMFGNAAVVKERKRPEGSTLRKWE